MATVIVLYGPKAVGKSWVAQALVDRLGVRHVDVDALVLDLLAAGVRPDPADGWLAWVEQRVVAALDTHPLVSVEATGAWDSDWRLADDLEARGVRVLRVWVSAPKHVTLQRLEERTARRVPVCRRRRPVGSTTRPRSRPPVGAWTCESTPASRKIRRRWSRRCGHSLG